mgnify:CR=1 FL=1
MIPAVAPRQEEARPPVLGNRPRSNPANKDGKLSLQEYLPKA